MVRLSSSKPASLSLGHRAPVLHTSQPETSPAEEEMQQREALLSQHVFFFP